MILIGVIIIAVIILLYLVPVGIWFQAIISGVHVNLVQLIFMRFRKVPPTVIVNNMISATKAGLEIKQNDLGDLNFSKIKKGALDFIKSKPMENQADTAFFKRYDAQDRKSKILYNIRFRFIGVIQKFSENEQCTHNNKPCRKACQSIFFLVGRHDFSTGPGFINSLDRPHFCLVYDHARRNFYQL